MNDVTNELREWLDDDGLLVNTAAKTSLSAIADRIDRAAEERFDSGYQCGQNSVRSLPDDMLADMGLVLLPTDEDGRPWHVGDRVDSHYEDEAIEFMTWTGKEWVFSCEHTELPADSYSRPKRKTSSADRLRKMADRIDGPNRVTMPDLTFNDLANGLRAIADELEDAE